MAGGKETPRQKMIGMMYLVLTALLALNVTKEVLNAFVTINDKLDASALIIDDKVTDDYTSFDLKKMSLIANDQDLKEFTVWDKKADSLEIKTKEMVHFILNECNDMIKEAEGVDWIDAEGKDENGQIFKLKPLMEINSKDNYDIATQLFIGSNPLNPNERGVQLTEKIHQYRDHVAAIMATYQDEDKSWSFTAPERPEQLSEALLTVNPKDSSKIAHFYNSLTIPATLYDYGEEQDIPWVSATFNHSPLVAAASMFTSLKVDVKNGESIAVEYLLAKIDAPIFTVNKIEPMAIASSGYMNLGDSLNLNVLIAAFDSTEVYTIRYGIDADTLPERWKEATGGINLEGASPGEHRVKGVIGVRQRNQIVWKPWEFDFTVGEPTGAIAQPEMRVFYRGYDNILEGSASGFAPDKVSLQGSGCSLRRQNGRWVATVASGVRDATVKVIGTKEDGSTVQVGSYDFVVKNLPKPLIRFGSINSGDNPRLPTVKAQGRVTAIMDPNANLTSVKYKILKGTITVSNRQSKGNILNGGALDTNAKKLLAQSRGEKVTMVIKYADPANYVDMYTISFDVK